VVIFGLFLNVQKRAFLIKTLYLYQILVV